MSRPKDPRFTPPLKAFDLGQQAVVAQADVPDEDIQTPVYFYREAHSDEEEAFLLNTYFKASYVLTSFEAALSYARTSRSRSHTVYVIMSGVGEGASIHVDQLNWNREPASENVDDENDRLRTFVESYGSHYIANIIYGYKIALRGSVSTNNKEDRWSFGMAFKAWGASGGLDVSQKRILSSANVEIRAEVTCGRMTPAHAFILMGYDEISTFLRGLRAGTTVITACPIRAKLNSYFATLTSCPKTQALLRESSSAELVAPYGVPRGTIVSWVPNPGDVVVGTNGAVTVQPPDGWVLCDGLTPGVPNLLHKFLRGETRYSEVGTTGGQDTHHHTFSGTTKTCQKDPDGWHSDGMKRDRSPETAGLDHSHGFGGTTTSESIIPPYFGVFYIMKL